MDCTTSRDCKLLVVPVALSGPRCDELTHAFAVFFSLRGKRVLHPHLNELHKRLCYCWRYTADIAHTTPHLRIASEEYRLVPVPRTSPSQGLIWYKLERTTVFARMCDAMRVMFVLQQTYSAHPRYSRFNLAHFSFTYYFCTFQDIDMSWRVFACFHVSNLYAPRFVCTSPKWGRWLLLPPVMGAGRANSIFCKMPGSTHFSSNCFWNRLSCHDHGCCHVSFVQIVKKALTRV